MVDDPTFPWQVTPSGVSMARADGTGIVDGSRLGAAEDPIGDMPAFPGAARTPLIFHTSRCGSTLLCRMLATGGSIVGLEPPFPFDLWASPAPVPVNDGQVRWLAKRWRSSQAPAVLKLSSVCTPQLPTIRTAFAGSLPSVLITRSPTATVRSWLYQPPPWVDLVRTYQPSNGRARFSSFLIERWTSAVEAALAEPDDSVKVVTYDQLVDRPLDIADSLATMWGLPRPDPAECERELTLYSKRPTGTDVKWAPAKERSRPELSWRLRLQIERSTRDLWAEVRRRAISSPLVVER